MNGGLKAVYFDAVAGEWDGWLDLPRLQSGLTSGLAELGVGEEEVVLDVGCGTGNLTAALLARLGPRGRVVAVDFSPAMIALARSKIADPRVSWQVARAERLPLPNAVFHRAICLAVWPHLEDEEAAGIELRRVLRLGGWVHIWHLTSRHQVNRVHAASRGPIREDLLPPAEQTAKVLKHCGFDVTRVVDDEERYLLTGVAKER